MSEQQLTSKHSQIILIVLISFLVGGLSGGIMGAIGNAYLANVIGGSGMGKGGLTLQKNIQENSAVIDVVKKVKPAVVSISVIKDISKYSNNGLNSLNNLFELNLPFGQNYIIPNQGQTSQPEDKKENKQTVGGGTGFIVSSEGLILTNQHVVSDTEAEYTVTTNDGTEYPAKVLAKDTINDLALIKIDAKNLPTINLGDSDKIEIGQSVIAIGNALGEFNNTVTTGVVSGIGRTVYAGTGIGGSEVIQEAIQTDAAINPGNSGGPLLNLDGEVIGINTAVSQEGQSVGFAIPINIAKKDIISVEEHGKIIRPWLGLRYTLINKNIAEQNKLDKDYGAYVIKGSNQNEPAIVSGSPAEKAGLKEGDIILEFNGKKITEDSDLAKEIMKYSPGDEVEIKYYRDKQEKTVKLKLDEYKEQ